MTREEIVQNRLEGCSLACSFLRSDEACVRPTCPQMARRVRQEAQAADQRARALEGIRSGPAPRRVTLQENRTAQEETALGRYLADRTAQAVFGRLHQVTADALADCRRSAERRNERAIPPHLEALLLEVLPRLVRDHVASELERLGLTEAPGAGF